MFYGIQSSNRYSFICLFVAVISCQFYVTVASASNSQLERKQNLADKYYDRQKYKQAYKNYMDLAANGDKYSQYKIAVMYYQGLGLAKSMTDAFAWAYLASEEGNSSLKQFKNAVWKKVAKGQQELAKSKALSNLEKYGSLSIAIKKRNTINKRVKSCTGSRVGSSCEALWSSGGLGGSFQSYLNVNAVVPAFTLNSDAGSAAALVSSVTAKDTFLYMDLKDTLKLLDRYIETHAGYIEIHDIEIVDE